jgi:hypothetical protein
LTGGAIGPSRAHDHSVVICEFVAKYQTLHLQEFNSDPGIAHLTRVAPVRDLDASTVTNVVSS